MVKIDLYSTRAVIRAQQVLTVGLVGVPVRFSFSEKWKCLSKVAVFRQGEVTVDVLLPGNLAVIPWQVLQEPGVPVQIGVYGMDADGKTVIPTVWAVTEPVRPSADPNGGENLEPASPLWQQVLSVIGSVDQLDTKEKQTLVQAINEANRAVHLVKVTGKGLENAGQGLPDALEAGKMALCYWEQEDVYLPLTHWVSDRDMTFSAVLRGAEYFVNIDPVGSRIYRCAKATFGGGGVYVGPEEPRDDGIILWVDPENDTPSDVARVLCVTVSEENGTLVADHYFEDIAQRLDQGYQVFCRYGNNDYRLLSRVSTLVIFGNLTGAVNSQIRIGKKNASYPVTVVKTNLIPSPEQAKPGQVLGVKSVDSTGALITWGPVDMVAGGSGGAGWQLIGEVETTEPVSSVSITGDTVFTEIIALMTVPPIPEDTGGVTYVRPVLKNKGSINANVGFKKPSTLQQREFWYINRNWGIRQYWQTGANTVASVVASLSSDTIIELTNEFNNGGGILGFNIAWNQNNTFPAGVKMQVWGR